MSDPTPTAAEPALQMLKDAIGLIVNRTEQSEYVDALEIKALEGVGALEKALKVAAREAAGGNERTYERLTEVLWKRRP